MRLREPALVISRETIRLSSSSACSSCCLSQAATGGLWPNVASITARSQPLRIVEGPTLPPSTALSASIRIDLPAPVSPVRTFSPLVQDTHVCSIRAKSLISSSCSMHHRRYSFHDHNHTARSRLGIPGYIRLPCCRFPVLERLPSCRPA